jgi:hypothetical protein
MGSSLRGSLAGLAALAAAAAVAPAAWAGCGTIQPAAWDGGSVTARLAPASFSLSIVGLWSVEFLVGGQKQDWGYAQWHADGTEIMNSGGRSPATENFCLGVWRQTGSSTYHLVHHALSYDATSGQINAQVTITEDVTVDPSGNHFTGPFAYDIYDPTGRQLLQHVPGQINGQRVLPN